jgi:hypothetical protein
LSGRFLPDFSFALTRYRTCKGIMENDEIRMTRE